jgi:acetyl esterase/lipase
VNGTVLYHAALEEAGIDVTFHLLENGGHGYGLRADKKSDASRWPILVEEWLRDRGII